MEASTGTPTPSPGMSGEPMGPEPMGPEPMRPEPMGLEPIGSEAVGSEPVASAVAGPSCAASGNNSDGYGCVHYRRRCWLFASCCDKFYVCRVCHDEEQGHELERHKVETIKCMSCLKSQSVSPKCQHCGIQFSEYFCAECRMFAGFDKGPIFHCEKCGICRKGDKTQVVHCDKCRSCVQRATLNIHKCRPYALYNNCPICRMDMFHSREPVVHLPCAHAMHSACFVQSMKYDYRCPMCFKSIAWPKEYFATIKRYVEMYVPEPQNEGRQERIYCNECEKKSTVRYHPMYKECPECHGFNTVQVNPDM